jgi:hypothetical protein
VAKRRRKPTPRIIKPVRSRTPVPKKPPKKTRVIKPVRTPAPKKPTKPAKKGKRSKPVHPVQKVIKPVKAITKRQKDRRTLFKLPKGKDGIEAVNPAKYKKVRNFITIFDDQTIEIASGELKRIAEEFAKYVQTIIYKQKYKWKPLSARYLQRKKDQHLDLRILIATKAYVQSIRAIPRRRDKKVVSWSVGPGGPGEIHEPSGLKLKTLARWLEFGTSRMPARPHWRPAWSAYIRKKKTYAKQIMKKIMKETKKGKKVKK